LIVKVAGLPKGITAGSPVKVTDLVATTWQMKTATGELPSRVHRVLGRQRHAIQVVSHVLSCITPTKQPNQSCIDDH